MLRPVAVRRVRRLLASILLVTTTAAFAPPAELHRHAQAPDCHHPAGPPMSTAMNSSTPGGCEHMSDGACAAMLVCASVALAVVWASVRGVTMLPVTGVQLAERPTVSDRLALGPPTPPPNS